MRNFLVAGNWKMNGSKAMVQSLLQQLIPLVTDLPNTVECVICPPSVYLAQCAEIIQKSNIMIGAQNVSCRLEVATTGEISPSMLREFGCKYVIIGHSERRHVLDEGDKHIVAKFKLAIENDLIPILCVGEDKDQMLAGLGFKTVERQLQGVIDQIGVQAFSNAVIAYEPVWAIGTGLSATPEQAQSMHLQIRALIAELDPTIAAKIKIIYGGSVNKDNAAELFKEPDINGGLVGGAALQAQSFSEICHAAMRMAE